MKLFQMYLTDDEADRLLDQAELNLRNMSEQARWYIRQGLSAAVEPKTSVHVRAIDKAEVQAVPL